MDVNLKDRLEKYNPKKHLLNVAEETRNYFLKQKNKNAKTHSSPEKLKADKKWVEFGKPSTRYVASYEEVLKIVSEGVPETFYGYIPNDKIFGISLWNRTDHINFTNVFSNLDSIGGMDWNSLHIKVVYFNGKFITVIGNHCTVKTIIMRGYGALIPVKIIYVGDTEEDMEKFMSRQHDIDANKRTNMAPVDRLVSQSRSGDKQGEKKMKILISLGYDVKNQVIANGKDLVNNTSHSYILNYVADLGYENVEYVSNLMRDVFEKEEHQAMVVGVLAYTYYLFKDKFEKMNKSNPNKDADFFKSFLKYQVDWALDKQEDFIQGSGKEKDLNVHCVRLINKLNKWCKSIHPQKDEFQTLSKVFISKKTFLNKIDKNNVPSNINEM
tara:strand:- start:460 stop:1608 length:1149 start_codon:yes stop_codon:yes gene_type:complete